ncbi:Ger(x)C family spore germination protein [Paenibacillus sp. FSL H7-0331]|uniref:Ger(x)C family spore germination protein n=1 Tax=Paenibacillus sp. FSL H7-0331 TaxID=1920421 RepID=UPI00096C3FDE|nr:Ger(x)C family spore germination protein [Paenibacillus sp. FSL H7-0331]OMF19172.1 spore gernimation protein KC [Paenibacillus sp. FSL H7-0331]
MNFKRFLRYCKGYLMIISCLCLTGCWDMVEVNQLAIVNFIGLDKNPDTGLYTVYYHIINPSGIATQKTSGINSPIYSYRIESKTIGEIYDKMLDKIPRRPFFDHYQSLVVTERTAKEGVEELINYLVKHSDNRSTIHMFVTTSRLSDIMDTYTTLERMPGRVIHTIVENQSKQSGRASKQSRVKDLVENMESSSLTILPLITLSSSQPKPTTNRYEQIDANKGNIALDGGAVFKAGQMIGKLKMSEMPLVNLLNGQITTFHQLLSLDGGHVNVRAMAIKVRKKIIIQAGQPVLKIDIKAKLDILENSQTAKLTVQNLDEIKKKFNEQVSEEAHRFYEKTKQKGWDILGVEEQIKRNQIKVGEVTSKDKNILDETRLEITVNCIIQTVGDTIDPFNKKR